MSGGIRPGARSDLLSVSVKRFYTVYLGVSLVVLFSGLVYRSINGFDRFWPMIGFSLLNLYVIGPLVWDGLRSDYAPIRGSVPIPGAFPCLQRT